jgi:hypothetical protein
MVTNCVTKCPKLTEFLGFSGNSSNLFPLKLGSKRGKGAGIAIKVPS